MSRNLKIALETLETLEKHGELTDYDRLGRFCASGGARVQFRNGTNELICCGVKGTATSGAAKELLASWTRAARRRLARKAGA